MFFSCFGSSFKSTARLELHHSIGVSDLSFYSENTRNFQEYRKFLEKIQAHILHHTYINTFGNIDNPQKKEVFFDKYTLSLSAHYKNNKGDQVKQAEKTYVLHSLEDIITQLERLSLNEFSPYNPSKAILEHRLKTLIPDNQKDPIEPQPEKNQKQVVLCRNYSD